MNASKLFIAFSIITAVFTSCDKKDKVEGNNATVLYSATTTNRTSGLVNWTSGAGSGRQIAFKGTSSTRVEVYALDTDAVDFFTNAAFIDTAIVPAGTYTNAEFNYQMTPTRSEPALQLKGTYNGTPVTVNIDLFTEIATKLPSVTLEARKTYKATLQLDLSAMMNGVSATQLNNATRTNGEILITPFINANLLVTITNNVNNVMQHPVIFQ
jgi:hypothetical protein